MPIPLFPLLLALGATAIAAVVLLAVVYALYRLFRWALRLLVGGVELGGLPPFSILVSLALAATIFSGGAESVWSFAYGLIRILFAEFPRAIVDIAFGAYACGDFISRDGSQSSDCLVRTALNLATSIGRIFSSSFTYLGNNLISILQFFAAWAVLAWLFRDLFGGHQEEDHLPIGPRAFFHDMTDQARMRLGLGAVVAIGAYLCLCAIVAVSLFKPVEKIQQLDPTRLKDRLMAARLSNDGADNPFSKRFPEDLGAFPKLADPKISDSSFYQILTTEYDQLSERWRQLRIDIAAEQDRLRELAAADYEIKNLNRVGSREQANHYLALEKWYQTSLTRLFGHLDNCRTAILLVRTSASADIAGRPGGAGLDGSDRSSVTGGFTAVYTARQACQSRPGSAGSRRLWIRARRHGLFVRVVASYRIDAVGLDHWACWFWLVRCARFNICARRKRPHYAMGHLRRRLSGGVGRYRCIFGSLWRYSGGISSVRRSESVRGICDLSGGIGVWRGCMAMGERSLYPSRSGLADRF